MTQRISRRSTLKAGAHAAWAVPAISLASAVPAYAESGVGSLQITVVSSEYSLGDHPTQARPDILSVRFSVYNSSEQAAEGMTVSVVIPPDVIAYEPSILNFNSLYENGVITGSLAEGWTVTATRRDPLGGLEDSGVIDVDLGFTDPVNEAPYRAWEGDPFTVGFVSTSMTVSTGTAAGPVAASHITLLPIEGFHAERTGDQLTIQGQLQNRGPRTSGPVTLTFWWRPDSTPDSRWVSEPAPTATAPGLTGGGLSGSGVDGDPWTYTFAGPSRATVFSGASATEAYVNFEVSITLGDGTPEATGARDVYLVAAAPNAFVPTIDTADYGWSTYGVADSD